MRLTRWVLGLLLVFVGAGLGASPAAAQTEGAEEWFENSAANVVRSHAGEELPNLSSDQVADLTVGEPVQAVSFTDQVEAYDQSNLWVAPILVDDEPVGTVATQFVSGESEREEITDDTRFSEALVSLPEDLRVVVEPRLGGSAYMGGWFLVGETVSPMDPVARSVLAGEVPITTFNDIRSDLLSSEVVSEETPEAEEETFSPMGILRTVAIVIVALLIVVGVLVWLRRDLTDSQSTKNHQPTSRPTTTTDEVKVLARPQRRSKREEKKNEDSDD
ncbi:MAG: hypothetical protein ACTH1Z_11235 [Ancrocorticia sp.]|uniref:hypothetical protein n=1 Tax=Ancrocorticia sp. TaxID=2593684 RepID=UPI003F903082